MLAECLSLGFVNVYFVGEPGEDWALVDTGLPWHFSAILKAAEKRYGRGCRPTAIWLTHGHWDHVGAARALAAYWNVPIYAHADELPYLTGEADYPPADPTACGAWLSLASHFTRNRGIDLRPWIQPLPTALLGGWTWESLPGHTPGSVGFWHAGSQTLLAGDAMVTIIADEWRIRQGLSWPPHPFTTDWFAVRKSLSRMAELAPVYVGFGHGKPMVGEGVAESLRCFHQFAPIARQGRYVGEPVLLDAERKPIVHPIPRDPELSVAKAVALGALALGVAYWWSRRGEKTS